MARMNQVVKSIRQSVKLNHLAVAAAVLLGTAAPASATTLSNSLTSRAPFVFNNGDVMSSSYDGSKYTAFQPFSSVATVSDLQAFHSFSGAEGGTTLTVQMLSEVGVYASKNQFGVTDKDGNFHAMLNGAAIAGSMGSLELSNLDQVTFGLKSPENMFSAEDSLNKDGEAHMLGLVVQKEGFVTYNFPSLDGNIAPFTFFAGVGDIILFCEDLAKTGNDIYGDGHLTDSDFDYNDAVFLIRATDRAVPEPTSVAMLAVAAALIGLRRKKVA